MRSLVKNKTFLAFIAAAVMLVWFSSSAGVSFAQTAPPTPVESGSGSGFLQALKTLGTPALVVMAAVLWVLQGIFTALLGLAGSLLNSAFQLNVQLIPADSGIVQEGWRIMRDIANSLFILVLLWIAFTIIFGVEQWGGKKLFTRVVIFAFLINFSLLMVSVTFGLANSFAWVFAKQIETTDIAGFIVDKIKLQTVLETTNEPPPSFAKNEAIERAYQEYRAGERQNLSPPPPTLNPGLTQNLRWNFKDSLFASLGIKEARADFLTTSAVGCGAAAFLLVINPIAAAASCAGAIILSSIASVLGSVVDDVFDFAFQWAVKIFISTLLLIITTATFVIGALVLYMRIIAEMLLAIFAPIVFAIHLIPVPQLKAYWNQWTTALFKWAFFAPAFYFLIYLTMKMLDVYGNALGVDKVQASLGGESFVGAILTFGFMIAAVRLARSTGGAVAEAVIGAGRAVGGFALGSAVGGTAMIARTLAAPMAKKLGEKIQRGDGPIYGTLRRAGVQDGLARITSAQRAAVSEAGKTYSSYTAEEIARMLPSEFMPERRAAMVKRLGELEELNKITDQQALASLRLLHGAGENVRQLLKQKPQLAYREPGLMAVTPSELAEAGGERNLAALRTIMKSIRPGDVAKLEKDSFDVTAGTPDEQALTRRVLQEAWINWSPEHWNKLMQHDPRMMNAAWQELTQRHIPATGQPAGPTIMEQLDMGAKERYRQFFNKSLMGRAMGYVWPTTGREATAEERKEIARLNQAIEDLERKLERLEKMERRDLKEEERTKLKREDLRDRMEALSTEIAEIETGREQPPRP